MPVNTLMDAAEYIKLAAAGLGALVGAGSIARWSHSALASKTNSRLAVLESRLADATKRLERIESLLMRVVNGSQ